MNPKTLRIIDQDPSWTRLARQGSFIFLSLGTLSLSASKDGLFLSVGILGILILLAIVLLLGSKKHSLLSTQRPLKKTTSYSQPTSREKSQNPNEPDILFLQQIIDTLLSSSQEGYLIFGGDGIAQVIGSTRCNKIFQSDLHEKPIWTLLGISKEEGMRWCRLLFHAPLPFDQIAALGPQSFSLSQEKQVTFRYLPIRDSNGNLSKILLLISEKRINPNSINPIEESKARSKIQIRMTQNRHRFLALYEEMNRIFLELEQLLENAKNKPLRAEIIYRHLHQLKGNAGGLSLLRLKEMISKTEDFVGGLKKENPFLPKWQLPRIKEEILILRQTYNEFLEENTQTLGSSINIDTQPLPSESLPKEKILNFFTPFDRFIQNLSKKRGKNIRPLQIKGGELQILAQPYRSLFPTLVYLFRNIILYEIETPKERLKRGKPAEATLTVLLTLQTLEGNPFLKIAIHHDGLALHPSESNPESESAPKKNRGLHRVKAATEKLGGSLKIHSKPNQGRLITISLPYLARTLSPPRTFEDNPKTESA